LKSDIWIEKKQNSGQSGTTFVFTMKLFNNPEIIFGANKSEILGLRSTIKPIVEDLRLWQGLELDSIGAGEEFRT